MKTQATLKTFKRTPAGRLEAVDVVIELDLDVDRLVNLLGPRAWAAKAKRSGLAAGAVVARVVGPVAG